MSYIELVFFSAGHDSLLITPYSKRDLKSHKIPAEVYSSTGGFVVSAIKLCRLIASMHDWDMKKSYRVPGIIDKEQKVVIFQLTEAEEITHQ